MEASVFHGAGSQQQSVRELNEDSSADRARECLLVISETDPASGFGGISLFQAFKEDALPDVAKDADKEDADKEDEYRQKLISISYAEAPIEQNEGFQRADAIGTAQKLKEEGMPVGRGSSKTSTENTCMV